MGRQAAQARTVAGQVTLTRRGRAVATILAAVLTVALLIWADYAMQIPGVDDARVDAEQLQ